MTVVFKLGGSLLTLPDLAGKLRDVLDQRRDERCLILIGGGATTDVVREWSRIHQLGEETAHWLAISSLDLNRQLIETLLPLRHVSSREAADQIWSEQRSPLLIDVTRFTKNESSDESDPLPQSWNVTSDSMEA